MSFRKGRRLVTDKGDYMNIKKEILKRIELSLFAHLERFENKYIGLFHWASINAFTFILSLQANYMILGMI